ncbi:Senescence marker protein-30 SMP-30 [Pseudomonas syringae pv. maculicola]|uniref:Senescence marker protein-30 n=1 Tax=Pseudomonas savastanoi pv. glycinea TaxID=318 RepID=A0A3M4YNA3_PSESG|nr:Senescence marker protein-30 SMP-30 [Pseudomonas savastanoi pv. phaseolicola]KPB79243.1 Senescence marker protein-30 SMP-30 [Pseudomonas syringae pv. maculicola]RMM75352.1 Senescence marker protein-30 [Pseudomonas savastanoi pv. glycinea]MBN4174534.1 hypothetical protein [Pseudomonas savastanoi pv. phaseolicola]RMO07299.1 Senescence marker protein-30 [Pseudomonas savastanoi pv. phaseolicola]
MRIEIVVDVKTTLGEGPVWDVEQQRLYWIDSFDGRVLRCTDDGRELRAWDIGQKIGSMALRSSGDAALVSLQTGIYNLDLPTGDLELIVDPEPGLPDNRLNDGKVDRHGRFIVGSMDTREDQASAKLYRLDPDLSLHTLDEGIIVSNGPCWSPGGETFYFADTWSGDIWAMTTTTPAAQLPTDEPSPRSTPQQEARRMAAPSMPKVACGKRWSTPENWCATPRTGRWIASSTCP